MEQFHKRQKTTLFTIEASPFYRQLYKPFYMKLKREFVCTPIIDKEVMMEHFDTLNTVHISKKEAFHVAFEREDPEFHTNHS